MEVRIDGGDNSMVCERKQSRAVMSLAGEFSWGRGYKTNNVLDRTGDGRSFVQVH